MCLGVQALLQAFRAKRLPFCIHYLARGLFGQKSRSRENRERESGTEKGSLGRLGLGAPVLGECSGVSLFRLFSCSLLPTSGQRQVVPSPRATPPGHNRGGGPQACISGLKYKSSLSSSSPCREDGDYFSCSLALGGECDHPLSKRTEGALRRHIPRWRIRHCR